MEILRISLLGPPSITWQDQEVRILRRLQRSLLYYLALHPKGFNREVLALAIWPDAMDNRKHLREALSRLRADLPAGEFLLADRAQVRLNISKIYVDAIEYQELAQQTRLIARNTPPHTALPEAIYQQMNKADALWRAPHFLAGANLGDQGEMDDWLINYGKTLELTHLNQLERLARHHIASGDMEAALRRLRSALEIDDLHPELHYSYLTLLMSLEQRREALEHCSRLERLSRRGDFEMPEDLLNLCVSLHEQSSVDCQKFHPLWPTWLTTQVPFVGRKNELEQLRRAYQRGGMAVVFGESGAGKTRLVYHLYHDLSPSPRLLLAPARSMESSLPFQPLIDMLRHAILPEEWQKLNRVWVVQILRLMPELAPQRQDVQNVPEDTPSEARNLIFEAIHQILIIAAENKRLLLFLDDAQWSDENSLMALAYLLKRNFFEQKGLLILAARSEDRNPALDALTSNPQIANIEKISLQPWSLAEVKEFIQHTVGQAPSEEVVQRMAEETGSNPLFLLETLRAMMEYFPNLNLQNNLRHIPLARNFHQTVRSRIQSLRQHTRQVLTAAAFLDRPFGVDLLEAAAQQPAEVVVQALEELAAAHLIRPIAGDDGQFTYGFIHDKLREIVLLELSQARQRLLHQRVARAMESQPDIGDESRAAIIAQHYHAGGEYPAAFAAWLRAGEAAYRRFSYKRACAAFQQAQQILERNGASISDEGVYQLYSSWGEAAEDTGDSDVLHALGRSLQQVGEERRNPLLAGAALGYIGCAQFIQNDFGQAGETLQQALIFLEQASNPREWTAVNTRIALVLAQGNRIPEAIQVLSQAIELGQGASDAITLRRLANAEYLLALLTTLAVNPKQGYELALRGIQSCQKIFYTYGSLRMLTIQATGLVFQGRYAEALDIAQKALRTAEAAQHGRLTGQALQLMGWSCMQMGRIDEAWEHINAARRQDPMYAEVVVGSQHLLGRLYHNLRAYPQAIGTFRHSLEQDPASSATLSNLYHLGVSLIVAGSRDEGEILVEQALELAESAGLTTLRLYGQVEKLIALATHLPLEALLEQICNLQVEAAERQITEIETAVELLLAQAALRQEQTGQAFQRAQDGLEAALQMSNPWLALHGCQILAAVHGKQSAAGAAARERAARILEKMRLHARSAEIQPLFETFAGAVLGELA